MGWDCAVEGESILSWLGSSGVRERLALVVAVSPGIEEALDLIVANVVTSRHSMVVDVGGSRGGGNVDMHLALLLRRDEAAVDPLRMHMKSRRLHSIGTSQRWMGDGDCAGRHWPVNSVLTWMLLGRVERMWWLVVIMRVDRRVESICDLFPVFGAEVFMGSVLVCRSSMTNGALSRTGSGPMGDVSAGNGVDHDMGVSWRMMSLNVVVPGWMALVQYLLRCLCVRMEV